MQPSDNDLIYDWNRAGGPDLRPGAEQVELDDETLRDGLQSPSVRVAVDRGQAPASCT